MKCYTIMKTRHGGFVVRSEPDYSRGSMPELYFAGTLDECLAFVKQEFATDAGEAEA